jgi:hypothetical protein
MRFVGQALLVPQSEAERGRAGRAKIALHRLFVSGLFEQGREENRVARRADMMDSRSMVRSETGKHPRAKIN